jgi:hypothetical protein
MFPLEADGNVRSVTYRNAILSPLREWPGRPIKHAARHNDDVMRLLQQIAILEDQVRRRPPVRRFETFSPCPLQNHRPPGPIAGIFRSRILCDCTAAASWRQ